MRIALALVLAGCAAVPDHSADRSRIFDATATLCWMTTVPHLRTKNPEAMAQVDGVLRDRKAVCTPELVESGRQMVLAQSERERQLNAAAQQRNVAAAGKALDLLLLMGAAAAMQPAPAATVNCNTYYGSSYSTTSCR